MAHAFAKIHVAAKQLGLDEDAQRDVYERVTGQRSLRVMNGPQIAAVNKEMLRLGFRPSRSKKHGEQLQGTYVPKMRALWMAAWNLGVIRNRSDKAMIAWTYRQTQIAHLNWVRFPEDANKAIDALKLWMRRQSGCDQLYTADWAHGWQKNSPQVQVIYSQWEILKRADACPMGTLFGHLRYNRFEAMKNHDHQTMIEIMNDLGIMVRACK